MNVENRQSKIHGLGTFAREPIEKGHWQYIYGMVVPVHSSYGFEHGDVWWEPYPPFRYVNHANQPNCIVVGYDDGTVTIEALRDIAEGEELTIHYGHDPAEEHDDN